jgi:hypothetical protein
MGKRNNGTLNRIVYASPIRGSGFEALYAICPDNFENII